MTDSSPSSEARQIVESAGIAWHNAEDKFMLADVLCDAVSKQLRQALAEHDSAMLVVSGGSTPAPVFERLAVTPLDWSRVVVTLADERWVPADHPDSNEALVKSTLLINEAKAAQFLPLYHADKTPEEAVQVINRQFSQNVPAARIVILGMGNDGHTASLFPDADEAALAAAMSLQNSQSVAVLSPPSVTQMRISLTRNALLQSQHRFLHITGESKTDVLCQALRESGETYQPGDKPIVGLLKENPHDASVYWSP